MQHGLDLGLPLQVVAVVVLGEVKCALGAS